MERNSNHIAVLRGAEVYTMQVYDNDVSAATEAALAKGFHTLISDEAQLSATGGASSDFVGILTSQERNWWAAERAELESNSANKASLEAIDTAMFVVALDQIDAGATLSTKVVSVTTLPPPPSL